MSQRRVGVVMGGASAERDVSMSSGRAVAEALLEAGHDIVPVLLGEGIDPLQALLDAQMDVAVLALHGRLGEDGCVQGMLEWLQIPYTGSSVLASALGMDKLKAKELFRLHNVPTPPYYTVNRASAAADLEEIHGSFGFPVVVKPRREGSSLGVSHFCLAAGFCLLAVSVAALAASGVTIDSFILSPRGDCTNGPRP